MCLYSKGSLFLDSISVVENFKFRTNTGSSINAYYSKPEMYQIPNLSTKDPVRAHKSTAEEKRSINISRNFPAFQHTRHNRHLSSRSSHHDTSYRCNWRPCFDRKIGGETRLTNKEENPCVKPGGSVIQILLSARDNSRYTSIRQCRTIAEREAARNRAVSLTTCNGTAVSIGCFPRESNAYPPPTPISHACFSQNETRRRMDGEEGGRGERREREREWERRRKGR